MKKENKHAHLVCLLLSDVIVLAARMACWAVSGAKVGSVSGPCRSTLGGLDEADDQRGSATVAVLLHGTCKRLSALHLVCMWLQTQPQRSRLRFIVCSHV